MLTRMIYVSTAVGPITTAVTGTILRSAKAHNAAHGITGVLCQGQGTYMQVLEGERNTLDELYARIQADKRHQNVVLRQIETITRRRYAKWSMAHVDLTQAHAHMTKMEQMAQGLLDFDPKTNDGEQMLEKIDALLATGTVMQVPVV